MHDRWCPNNLTAEGCADTLVAQTNAENRYTLSKATNDIAGDARLLGCAGTGRNKDFIRMQSLDFIQRDFIIPKDLHIGAQLAEIMEQIVGEGIVVVDEKYHHLVHCSARSTALSIARALLSVS